MTKQSLTDYLESKQSLPSTVLLEDLFKDCGGFGKFQLFSAILNTLTNAGACFLLQSFAFLTVEPVFKCQFDST